MTAKPRGKSTLYKWARSPYFRSSVMTNSKEYSPHEGTKVEPKRTLKWATSPSNIRHSRCGQLLFDFSATWCVPSKVIEPVFNAISAKFPVAKFIQIDFDKLSDVSQQWGVQATLTSLVVKGRKEMSRVVGAKKELQHKVEQFIAQS